MVAEARRCIDLDLKGFVLPDKPEMMGLRAPGFPGDHWAPAERRRLRGAAIVRN